MRQLHSTQNLGRQVVFQQRDFRRANPNFVNPNRPNRQLQPGQTGRMARPDKSGPDNCSLVRQIVPDSSSNPVTAPVDSRRRAHRTAGTAAAGLPTPPREHPCRPPDSRRDPICRRSPACPRVNRNNQYVPAQPGTPQGRPGLNRFGVPGLQRAPAVQGAPALQRPASPAPRRPAPHRNGASRRRTNCGKRSEREDQAARRSQSRIR